MKSGLGHDIYESTKEQTTYQKWDLSLLFQDLDVISQN